MPRPPTDPTDGIPVVQGVPTVATHGPWIIDQEHDLERDVASTYKWQASQNRVPIYFWNAGVAGTFRGNNFEGAHASSCAFLRPSQTESLDREVQHHPTQSHV